MDFHDTIEEAAFRLEARAWIDNNTPNNWREVVKAGNPDEFLNLAKEWQAKKREAGWACISWPKEYGGRAAKPIEQVIWQQEEGELHVLSIPFGIGIGMIGPTLMAYASSEQKRRYLPKLASGEEIWCQLFSEPAAGSDLAGLRTKAEKDGDDWIINGQKIWTTGAHFSDYGIIVTRSDSTVPKHMGLTFFFVDMNLPGIEVRPIKQLNGDAEFNEVFFTDVRIPDTQRLGEIGDGWRVALTTLMNERQSFSGSSIEISSLVNIAKTTQTENGLAIDDQSVRNTIADHFVTAQGINYTAQRSITALSKGKTPGPEASIIKLASVKFQQDMSYYCLDLQDMMGSVIDTNISSDNAQQMKTAYWMSCMRLAGGSDEVLRNIIAERVLGLPGEIRVDKELPFNQIPTSQ